MSGREVLVGEAHGGCAVTDGRGHPLDRTVAGVPGGEIALTLGISLDELLHPKAKKLSGKKPSRRVLRRLEQIERLPRRKQTALLTTIDAFLSSATG